MTANELSATVTVDTTEAERQIKEAGKRLNSLQIGFWSYAIIRLSLSIGIGALVLSLFFALIYIFLRWVL